VGDDSTTGGGTSVGTVVGGGLVGGNGVDVASDAPKLQASMASIKDEMAITLEKFLLVFMSLSFFIHYNSVMHGTIYPLNCTEVLILFLRMDFDQILVLQ
jgi:hypothetical protein